MWAARDLRFGGAKRRYQGGAQRAVRSLDPFTAELRQFSSTLRDDNYILRNNTPHVISTSASSGGLPYLYRGQKCRARCDLLTTFDDGIRIADLVAVCLNDRVQQEWDELQNVAPSFGIVPKLRLAKDIRANLTLLQSLGAMHQHLVLHPTEAPDLEEGIRSTLPDRGECPAHELRRELGEAAEDEFAFQGSLYRLYRRGLISLNLSEAPYGPRTRVANT